MKFESSDNFAPLTGPIADTFIAPPSWIPAREVKMVILATEIQPASSNATNSNMDSTPAPPVIVAASGDGAQINIANSPSESSSSRESLLFT